MARASHERVVFRSSFSNTWFGSFRPGGYGIFSDDFEQLIEQTALFPWSGMSAIECFRPLAQGIDSALEAEAGEVGLIECCCLLHESAHKVVGDDMQSDFFANHLGGTASQNIHAECDFDISEEQLNAPAAEIKLGQFFGWISDGVGQCGDDHNGLGPEAWDIDLDVQHSQRKRLGKRLPFLVGIILGLNCRLGPCDETIFRSQAFAFAEVGGAGVMNTHHGVDAFGEQFSDGTVRTKSSVGERNIAVAQKTVLLAEEAALVDMLVTFLQPQQRPTGETEAPHQFCNGKPAPLGLIGVLRPYSLVFGRVGHGNAGAVDDFDMAAQPQLLGDDTSLKLPGRVGLDIVKRLKRKTRSRLAISACGGAWNRESPCRVPCLDLADDFPAGTAGGQYLGQESPEGDRHRVRSSSTIRAMCGRFKKSGGGPWLTDACQLTERALAQVGDPGSEPLLCGRPFATEQNTMEAGKERG